MSYLFVIEQIKHLSKLFDLFVKCECEQGKRFSQKSDCLMNANMFDKSKSHL